MSIAPTSAATPYYLAVRPDWLGRRKEPILAPDLPIVDAHHHYAPHSKAIAAAGALDLSRNP